MRSPLPKRHPSTRSARPSAQARPPPRRCPGRCADARKHDAIAALEMPVLHSIWSQRCSGGHLDRGRQLRMICYAWRRPHGGHRVADLLGKIELGAGEALRRILKIRRCRLLQRESRTCCAAGPRCRRCPRRQIEHDAALRGGRRVVEVHDGPLRALQRFIGAADQRFARLREHLHGHVVGDAALLDQATDEIEVGLGRGWKADLDLLVAHLHQQFEHPKLAFAVHGLDERLVAVAQIDAAPHRGRRDRLRRPGAIGNVDRVNDAYLVAGAIFMAILLSLFSREASAREWADRRSCWDGGSTIEKGVGYVRARRSSRARSPGRASAGTVGMDRMVRMAKRELLPIPPTIAQIQPKCNAPGARCDPERRSVAFLLRKSGQGSCDTSVPGKIPSSPAGPMHGLDRLATPTAPLNLWRRVVLAVLLSGHAGIAVHAANRILALPAPWNDQPLEWAKAMGGTAVVLLLAVWRWPHHAAGATSLVVLALAMMLLTPGAVCTVALCLASGIVIGKWLWNGGGFCGRPAPGGRAVGHRRDHRAFALAVRWRIHSPAIHVGLALLMLVLGAPLRRWPHGMGSTHPAAPRHDHRTWLDRRRGDRRRAPSDHRRETGGRLRPSTLHLQLPELIAAQRSFRHSRPLPVASMPLGADYAFATAYLMGNESAARALNLAFGGLACALAYRLAANFATREAALACVTLFAAMPLATLVTGSLFSETLWTAFLLAALVVVVEASTGRASPLPALALVAGGAMATKVLSVPWLSIWFRTRFGRTKRGAVRASRCAFAAGWSWHWGGDGAWPRCQRRGCARATRCSIHEHAVRFAAVRYGHGVQQPGVQPRRCPAHPMGHRAPKRRFIEATMERSGSPGSSPSRGDHRVHDGRARSQWLVLG